ncbi:hypothetical protein MOJ79_14445 [Calidifontimicrobium sp. SYSU G02091]|uniref:hypothetical protein n=1 Tax=Calidifontimicrobium sp. SYSU G02091 TaxID=2926421 RepID=UPI001F52CBA8|nr:hypothetical protein [Calidifontimicrobium sp. SYSU G02091]MCI1193040.1 hypothetical protein [Calidifontimicrobium sp. SYSU G02091]
MAADAATDDRPGDCCAGPTACVFTKAVLAREAGCGLARRQAVGERDLVTCASPVAHTNCATLVALLRERATFALRLPPHGAPLVHAKALQLQCGGVRALQRALGDAPSPDAPTTPPDVHRLVGLAHARWGSLMDAPWGEIVPALATWQPRRRHRPGAR